MLLDRSGVEMISAEYPLPKELLCALYFHPPVPELVPQSNVPLSTPISPESQESGEAWTKPSELQSVNVNRTIAHVAPRRAVML